MTKGRKTGGRDFKPGQSGNPAGRTPLPEDLKSVKILTNTNLRARVQRLLDLPTDDLVAYAEDPKLTALDAMIASIVVKAVVNGDQQRLDFILNRLVGKVQDKVEVTMPKPFVVVRQSGEQVVMGAEVKEEE